MGNMLTQLGGFCEDYECILKGLVIGATAILGAYVLVGWIRDNMYMLARDKMFYKGEMTSP